MESIHAMLMRSQLRWAGHVVRMPDERLPKQLLCGDLCAGKRSRGGQKKRFKDTLKVSLKRCGFDIMLGKSLHQIAQPGAAKSALVSRNMKRSVSKMPWRSGTYARRGLTSHHHLDKQLHPCPHCSRQFRAPIGLRSHLRTHHAWSCSSSFVKEKKEDIHRCIV